MNIVMLQGRLTDNPDIKSNGNTLISNFTLKISDYINGKEHISFVSCVCFGELAEISQQRLMKGFLIRVEGTIKQERYTNKHNQHRNIIKVIIEKINILQR